MRYLTCDRALPTLVALFAIAAFAQPESAEASVSKGARVLVAASATTVQGTAGAQPSGGKQPPSGATGSGGPSGTKASVACKQLQAGRVRCTMTIKGGAGISGTVTMRITRGKLLVALGRGSVTRGKATLTMRVLRRMTPGRYTVAMVVTLKTTSVLQVR